jgi:hypothetical protein
VTRVQPPHLKGSQALQGEPEGCLIPAGEIGAAESPVREDGVARDEVPGLPVIQADPARGMAGSMDHLQFAHQVPIPKKTVGRDRGSPLTEDHRCRKEVARKPRGIGGMDADIGPGHVPDLGQAGDVVVVAVGENDHFDLICKGPDLQG